LTLFQYGMNGTSSATYAGNLALPQAATGANGNLAAANGNFPISGEYGSSSEGTLQLSGNGQYLTIMGYGVNANAYNANQSGFNVVPGNTKIALGQTCSLSSCGAFAVPRVVATISANGTVNSTTAVYGVFNDNNPRSVYSANGTNFYISGQGNTVTSTSNPNGLDNTGGVFYTTLGSNSATAITGNNAGGTTQNPQSQETNEVQINNNTLFVSTDSKEGSTNRDFIGTLGTAGSPPTTVSNGGNGPAMLPGFGSSNGHGTQTINGNGLAGQNGKTINLSPQNFFFANATTLHVADSGSPKNSGGSNSSLGDGGLQKWTENLSTGV
jgi:hypothetical protein